MSSRRVYDDIQSFKKNRVMHKRVCCQCSVVICVGDLSFKVCYCGIERMDYVLVPSNIFSIPNPIQKMNYGWHQDKGHMLITIQHFPVQFKIRSLIQCYKWSQVQTTISYTGTNFLPRNHNQLPIANIVTLYKILIRSFNRFKQRDNQRVNGDKVSNHALNDKVE